MKREQYGIRRHIGVDPGDPTEGDLVKMATEQSLDAMYRDIGREAQKRKAAAVYIEAPLLDVRDGGIGGTDPLSAPGRVLSVKTSVEFYEEGDLRPMAGSPAITWDTHLGPMDPDVPELAPEDVEAAKRLGVDPNASPRWNTSFEDASQQMAGRDLISMDKLKAQMEKLYAGRPPGVYTAQYDEFGDVSEVPNGPRNRIIPPKSSRINLPKP